MQAVWRFLLSRRVAAVAIGAMAGLLLVAALAPGPGDRLEELRASKPLRTALVERLRPARLAGSAVFIGLSAFLGLSVAASMAFRIRSHLGRRRRGGGAGPERFVARRTLVVRGGPGDALEAVRAALSGLGDRPEPAPGVAAGGGRRNLGFVGSMIFHGGLLVVLGGAFASARGRFAGEVTLTEGFPLELSAATLARADPPERIGELAGVRLAAREVSARFATLESTAPVAPRLTDVSALLDIGRGPEQRTEVASVNQPVEIAGYRLTLHRYGFAPELSASDPAGRLRASGVAAVRVLPPGSEDAIPLEGGGELRLRLYPDFARVRGAPASRSDEPLHPVIAWRWLEAGEERASGLVARGGEAVVGGYRVAFPALHYWADFLVGRDPGAGAFAAGAFLCIAGLALRFSGYERAWRAQARAAPEGGTELELELSARYFPASLEARADRVALALGSGDRNTT